MEQINVIKCTNEGSDFYREQIAECRKLVEESERKVRDAEKKAREAEKKEMRAKILNRLSIAYVASATFAAGAVSIYILARASYILALWG